MPSDNLPNQTYRSAIKVHKKKELNEICHWASFAEGEGFKPPIPERGIPDFESSAIDHSANLPIKRGPWCWHLWPSVRKVKWNLNLPIKQGPSKLLAIGRTWGRSSRRDEPSRFYSKADAKVRQLFELAKLSYENFKNIWLCQRKVVPLHAVKRST